MLQRHTGSPASHQIEIFLTLVILHHILPPHHQPGPVNMHHIAEKLFRIDGSILHAGIRQLVFSDFY